VTDRKLAAFALSIIGTTVGGLMWFSASISQAITKHSAHPHKPTAELIDKLDDEADKRGERLVRVETKAARIRVLEAKIDYLIVVAPGEANASSTGRRARITRQAAKVRQVAADSGDSADPLAGLE
jgi:hypothetical protein